MRIVGGIAGVCLIAVIMWEAFEVVVLPRRVSRRWRLTRLFYRVTWLTWARMVRPLRSGRRREQYLSFYGPLSLLLLLTVWAAGMVVGFGLLHWSLGSTLNIQGGGANFATDLYMSGTTFFTLGLGDVTPRTDLARVVTVLEAGTGFGFLALVISYLPVLYQAFSRREVSITLLDARAGSPPSAAELFRRHGRNPEEELTPVLRDWERWAAELLESHLSYPVLCYYRSQHSNQSWLAALTTILDASALVMAGLDGIPAGQARLTFAMARHAVVDLAQIFQTAPCAAGPDRLSAGDFSRLRETLELAGVSLVDGGAAEAHLAKLRSMYEPYVRSLAEYLGLELPAWVGAGARSDNWQTSAWGRISPEEAASSVSAERDGEHY